MPYTKVSITKRGTAGSPIAKDPNIILINVKDIAVDTAGKPTGFPTKDASGVKTTSNITLKSGAKAMALYATRSTIKRFDTSDGAEDAMGFVQNVEFETPGDLLEANEFIQNNLNEDFLILTTECSDATGTRLHGTPCNPMKIKFEQQDDNEGKKMTFKFASVQRSQFKMAHYAGTIPTIADYPTAGSGSGGI